MFVQLSRRNRFSRSIQAKLNGMHSSDIRSVLVSLRALTGAVQKKKSIGLYSSRPDAEKKEEARVAPGLSWHSYLYPIGKQSDEVVVVVVAFVFADALLFSVVLIVQKVAVAFLTSINPPGEASVVWLVVVCSS
jgi:hypothetical protein